MYHIEKEELFVMLKAKNDNDTKLVERQINNYRRINLPHIPKYYGTIVGENCLIIDFINGQTLDNIAKMHLDFNDKLTIIFQLLIIFKYLHENEFVYRDLSPVNVIIDEKKEFISLILIGCLKFQKFQKFQKNTQLILNYQYSFLLMLLKE